MVEGSRMPPVSELEETSLGLKRSDCTCPVCLTIFMEPVTLPCTHTFCKPCFLETVDKSNICCPLCRKRVSSWARLNSRNKTLVNEELWKRIQDAFPIQCERRVQGIDDEEDAELRKEYEDQVSKLVEEKRALEEAECRASEEYIQRLLAEEEERMMEERRQQEERQLENDEKLARLLSLELNSGDVSASTWSIKPSEVTPAKRSKANVGDIEKFLRPVAQKHPSSSESSPDTSLMANKENILSPPTLLSNESMEDRCELPLPALESSRNVSSSEEDSVLYTSVKRKSSEIQQDHHPKRQCAVPQSTSSSSESLILSEMSSLEETLCTRWQQEEADRRLAFKLQKALDRENSVDRRKGSADSYLLRQKSSRESSTSSSADVETRKKKVGTKPTAKTEKTLTEKETPGKRPVSSPPSVLPKSLKGTKQTTLTEMFPNMCN
ncbi:hypothetical protein DNTS_022704 [Danionella cerebrum]|uniref:RING-type E3 ubiquitin transferase n=1 Tax=Danionella cerebrum TaxID=2873325 RepID=A0A553MY03_9TELE|nr:hypothetical protein DNTS_022704 [Danionella translucida]